MCEYPNEIHGRCWTLMKMASSNFIGASPFSHGEQRGDPCAKNCGIKQSQHTTVVWYSSSCTNTINLRILPYKCFVMWNIRLCILTFHVRLVRSTMHKEWNSKDYDSSILGWYGQPCHKQWNCKEYSSSIKGWYSQPCHNE